MRIPVRAALRQLEAEGLVVFSAHRGATVRTLSAENVAEIYELRSLLETYALRAAIDNVTPGQLDELEQIADELDSIHEGEPWLELRQQFYDLLYTIADRPLTAELISKLRADVGRYWLTLRLVGQQEDRAHRVIADSIRAGDHHRAEAWLQEHLGRVSAELQRRVRRQSQEG